MLWVESFFTAVSNCLYSLKLVSGFTRWLVSLAPLASTSPLCGVSAGYGAALAGCAPRPNLRLLRRVLSGQRRAYYSHLSNLLSVGLTGFRYRGVTHYKQPNSAKYNRSTFGVLGARAVRF